jgi:hypothetical protein
VLRSPVRYRQQLRRIEYALGQLVRRGMHLWQTTLPRERSAARGARLPLQQLQAQERSRVLAFNVTLRKDFEKRSGETTTCDVPGGSGAMHRQHVCPSCLIRTHSELLAHPEVINVRPGTLDTPAAVAPIAQIWTSLALPWALLPNIPHYEENPPDVPVLMGLWRETHSAKLT